MLAVRGLTEKRCQPKRKQTAYSAEGHDPEGGLLHRRDGGGGVVRRQRLRSGHPVVDPRQNQVDDLARERLGLPEAPGPRRRPDDRVTARLQDGRCDRYEAHRSHTAAQRHRAPENCSALARDDRQHEDREHQHQGEGHVVDPA